MTTDPSMRMMELSLQGFGCSQIMITLALEAQGKNNPDLVRAVSGLHGGLGFSGKICGALTGGCCLLALYAGKGTVTEMANGNLLSMIQELVHWFEEQYGLQYGGIDCADILEHDFRNQISRCPSVVAETLAKANEILAANGIDLHQSR
jgi:C_GCAxxG_C_C family probable redox protein